MHSNIHQIQPPAPRDTASERPLAQSALSGEARLRELEHLAETARKVRDQAASELTRNSGATHHIARDRMAAAERMLRKAQQEIAELRGRQNVADAATTPAAQRKDFELAVMLGHSKARFNLDNPSQLTLQEQEFSHRNRDDGRTQGKRAARGTSSWRSLMFGLLAITGIGIGTLAAYGFLSTGTVDGATQAVRDGTSQMVDRLRSLLAISAVTDTSARSAA